jgi:prepilin peptidase CpaA
MMSIIVGYWLRLMSAGGGMVLLALAWHDLQRRRLPNRLVAAVALLYILSALPTPSALLPHLALGATGLLMGMLLVAAGVIGGGDGKLIAAVLCWSGLARAGPTLVIISQVGLLLALAGLACRWSLRRQPPEYLRPMLRCLTTDRGVPYGVALAAGGLYAIAEQFN